MVRAVADKPPVTVTAEFSVQLKKPTPSDKPVHLRARVMESSADRAVVEATLVVGRHGVRHRTRHVRGREAGPSRLPPLVSGRRPGERPRAGPYAGDLYATGFIARSKLSRSQDGKGVDRNVRMFTTTAVFLALNTGLPPTEPA